MEYTLQIIYLVIFVQLSMTCFEWSAIRNKQFEFFSDNANLCNLNFSTSLHL